MTHGWRQTLVLATIFFPAWARAEEAVSHQGRRYSGTLRKAEFIPATGAKAMPVQELQLVQFPDHPPARPRCRILHQILFPGSQRLAGELLGVDTKNVQFRLPSGELLSLPRRRL